LEKEQKLELLWAQVLHKPFFSSSGKGNFFTKLTTFLAIAFMANSIALTTLSTNKSSESIFDDETPVAPRLNSDAVETEGKADAAKTETKAEAKPAETQKK
jgi:preprotein translocase subunit SecG